MEKLIKDALLSFFKRTNKMITRDQVKALLVLKKTQELSEKIRKPENKELLKDIAENLARSITDIVAMNMYDPNGTRLYDAETKKDATFEYEEDDFKKMFDQEYEQFLNNSNLIKEQMIVVATYQYMGKEEYVSLLKNTSDILGIKKETFDIDNKILFALEKNEKIVDEVTKSAIREGVDVATSQEKLDEVLRKIFKSPEEYVKHHSKNLKRIEQFYEKVQNLALEKSDEGSQMYLFSNNVKRLIHKLNDKHSDILNEDLNKDVIRIYFS